MADELHREMGETLEATHGKKVLTFRRVLGYYDYKNKPTTCPICGELGMPWAGWFSCEYDQAHVALVHNGEAFLMIDRKQEAKP